MATRKKNAEIELIIDFKSILIVFFFRPKSEWRMRSESQWMRQTGKRRRRDLREMVDFLTIAFRFCFFFCRFWLIHRQFGLLFLWIFARFKSVFVCRNTKIICISRLKRKTRNKNNEKCCSTRKSQTFPRDSRIRRFYDQTKNYRWPKTKPKRDK